MPKIFITRALPGPAIDELHKSFGEPSVEVFAEDRVIRRDELLQGVQGANALLPILTETIDAGVMDAAGPQLKIIANYAVGYNNIDIDAATERKIIVTNTPGVLTETTADLAWALILGATRRTGEGERFLRAGKWDAWSPQLLLGPDVHGKTLGIFGMGRIGEAVARRAWGFNMPILYANRNRRPPQVERELNATYVDKETLLAQADILSLHCPLTPETRHAFGAPEFEAMKKTVVFINTTRGPVVDEAALAEALQSGEIAAAGLDVYEEEPSVHPELLKCENAMLLPHMGSGTFETRGKMAEIAAKNIIAVLGGQAPLNCVNPEAL